MNDLFLVSLFSIAGSGVGILTGLIPGLHTNNIALLMLFFASLAQEKWSIYFCIFLVSASITHTFLDIIPSTFIGAAEEDTALVVLPAHSMLLEGRGYDAIAISALSSLASVITCFLLLLPFKFILAEPANLYLLLEKILPWILICISLLVIFTNENFLYALLIFFLSGIFGMVILNMNTSFMVKSSSIFPALAGLFGVPAIIRAYKTVVPEQTIGEKVIEENRKRMKKRDVISGTIAGGIVSVLPGVSSAIATTIALITRKERNRENTISILSATNTATNFFVLATLFILLKARSGFAIAISKLVSVEKWDKIIFPYPFNLFLIATIISSLLSYYATLKIGRVVAKNISNISYSSLLKISLAIIILMVFIFNGVLGMLILFVASSIGLLCLEFKVRRSVCMGILLLPLILRYFL